MSLVATAAAAALSLAVVAHDRAPLRAAPARTAAVHAQLAQGESVEVRDSRGDYLQVYDHKRERAGYVQRRQLRPLALDEAAAPELLAVVRFLRDAQGGEALGIAYVAAYLKAAPAAAIDGEPFDALGVMAERLADRASSPGAGSATTTALDTVGAYGVRFDNREHNGRVRLCYDGEAFRRVLALHRAGAAAVANPASTGSGHKGSRLPSPVGRGAAPAIAAEAAGGLPARARAALALTRHDCVDPSLRGPARLAHDRERAALLDAFSAADLQQLDATTTQRLHLRRAGVWAAVAFAQSRTGEPPMAAAARALDELAAVRKGDLDLDDADDYDDAALRVGAVRWAAAPPATSAAGTLRVQVTPGEPGQACVQLVAAPSGVPAPVQLAERCTWGTPWLASAAPSADGRALALAVQPLEGWTELWVFRRTATGWQVQVLPPAPAVPDIGYTEFAGWTPGRSASLLLVREARADGRFLRRFEVLELESLTVQRSAATARQLSAFGRWASPTWRRTTLSER